MRGHHTLNHKTHKQLRPYQLLSYPVFFFTWQYIIGHGSIRYFHFGTKAYIIELPGIRRGFRARCPLSTVSTIHLRGHSPMVSLYITKIPEQDQHCHNESDECCHKYVPGTHKILPPLPPQTSLVTIFREAKYLM